MGCHASDNQYRVAMGWGPVTVFLGNPSGIRTILYTTHAIESLNDSLQKVLKTCGEFPTDESSRRHLLKTHQRFPWLRRLSGQVSPS